jgi:hypothetical protein
MMPAMQMQQIDALEVQLQQHEQGSAQQQELAGRPSAREEQLQQQLAATQQELALLRDEHTQYVATTSQLLTLLQTQMQQLLTAQQRQPLQEAAHTLEQLLESGGGGLLGGSRVAAAPSTQPGAAGRSVSAVTALPAEPQHHERPGSAAASAAPRSSGGGAGGGGLMQRLSAAAVSTSSPCKPPAVAGGGGLTSPNAKRRLPLAAAAAAAAAPPAAIDALALPSYPGLRHRAGSVAGISGSTAADNAPSWLAALQPAVPAAGARGGSAAGRPAAAEAGAAAVWQAGLGFCSTLPSQQMELLHDPDASVGLTRSLASAHAFLQQQRQGAGDAQAAGGDRGVLRGMQQPGSPSAVAALQYILQRHSSRPEGAAGSTSALSNAARVPMVMTESAAGLEGVLSRGRNVGGLLPGLEDVDRGIEEGLQRAAVGRVHTAAGCLLPGPSAGDSQRQQRVLPAQLKGNMSLRDHLRAAATAAAPGSNE